MRNEKKKSKREGKSCEKLEEGGKNGEKKTLPLPPPPPLTLSVSPRLLSSSIAGDVNASEFLVK